MGLTIELGVVAVGFGLIATIGGFIFAVHKVLARFERLEEEAVLRKEDTKRILRALLACLDGLQQQGANHAVTEVYKELNEYIVDSR